MSQKGDFRQGGAQATLSEQKSPPAHRQERPAFKESSGQDLAQVGVAPAEFDFDLNE